MDNKHLFTLEEMRGKRDRLAKELRITPSVGSVGLRKGDSLVVLLRHSGIEDRLPKEFEGCVVTSVVVGEASA